jgi:hypothetical protein
VRTVVHVTAILESDHCVTLGHPSMNEASAVPYRQIRAHYTATTIRVYQAFSDAIAEPALAAGTFRPPFKLERMTWIKPSFLWMMYRAGWGYKDAGQRRILAIDILRSGFDWALQHAVLSTHGPGERADWEARKRSSPVRVQWDPERNLQLAPLPYRCIQVGLSGEAVRLYIEHWIQGISEITELAHQIHAHVQARNLAQAATLLPVERIYQPQLEDRSAPDGRFA